MKHLQYFIVSRQQHIHSYIWVTFRSGWSCRNLEIELILGIWLINNLKIVYKNMFYVKPANSADYRSRHPDTHTPPLKNSSRSMSSVLSCIVMHRADTSSDPSKLGKRSQSLFSKLSSNMSPVLLSDDSQSLSDTPAVGYVVGWVFDWKKTKVVREGVLSSLPSSGHTDLYNHTRWRA